MIPRYRAFYKANQKMYEVLTLDIIDEKVLIENNDNPKSPLRGYVKITETELMQYTCLKDKNGKEIYEGDIVAFEDSDGGYEYQDLVINTGIVEYGDLGFYFTNRVAVEMDDFYIKDGRCDEVEVIGNIYENPLVKEIK